MIVQSESRSLFLKVIIMSLRQFVTKLFRLKIYVVFVTFEVPCNVPRNRSKHPITTYIQENYHIMVACKQITSILGGLCPDFLMTIWDCLIAFKIRRS